MELMGLVGLCTRLGATDLPLSRPEQSLVKKWGDAAPALPVADTAALIRTGADPLGDLFCGVRTPEERRPMGQTYTPTAIVDAMVAWASQRGAPRRVVDPGAGSGRYLLAAARAFPQANLVGADTDPIATLMLKANIVTMGLSKRASVVLGDYRTMTLPAVDGPTLFIGNPPYVRHHQITADWKRWLLATAHRRGFKASGLAGLHVHFFLATAEHARPGDFGAFVTSAEWLDVNYGSLVRELLLDGLGGESLHVLDPQAAPFPDATTTAAITCFGVGGPDEQRPSMRVRRVTDVSKLGSLTQGRSISRARLAEANRWSVLTRVTPKLPEGFVELGELCAVHRGTVTGANKVWVRRACEVDLPPGVLFPSVTKALELFKAGEHLTKADSLRLVIDLPVDLDILDASDRKRVDRFLRAAKRMHAHTGYVATNRRAWWSVGLREPAPVLATYMARRPPAFVRNDAAAHHINIAHGLYPRQPIPTPLLDAMTHHLRNEVSLTQGRTYAGGLTKFEPKEMERLPVPGLDLLVAGARS